MDSEEIKRGRDEYMAIADAFWPRFKEHAIHAVENSVIKRLSKCGARGDFDGMQVIVRGMCEKDLMAVLALATFGYAIAVAKIADEVISGESVSDQS